MAIFSNVSADLFRDAMTCFASGVTAITAEEAGVSTGMIATSVCSVSMEPPTLLICVNKSASIHEVISRTRKFSVNLLATGHTGVVQRFMTSRGGERFDWEAWNRDPSYPPTLAGSVVAFNCDLIATHEAYTHTIMIGQVQRVDVDRDNASQCLLWHRQGFSASVPNRLAVAKTSQAA